MRICVSVITVNRLEHDVSNTTAVYYVVFGETLVTQAVLNVSKSKVNIAANIVDVTEMTTVPIPVDPVASTGSDIRRAAKSRNARQIPEI